MRLDPGFRRDDGRLAYLRLKHKVIRSAAIASEHLESIAAGLRAEGLAICPGLLGAELIDALAQDCESLARTGKLQPARIGRGQSARLDATTRNDLTHWIEAHPGFPVRARLLEALDGLRLQLNRVLLLGLRDVEAHYALYPTGAFYARHCDRFRDDDQRVLSFTCYLNADWRSEQGGALRLWLPQGPRDVWPERGVCSLFLSDEIEHEVLPATRPRYSIAGWFRRD